MPVFGKFVAILCRVNVCTVRAAVRIGTGEDAPRTGEELKGPRGPNISGGTKKSTRLTSKYVLRGKTKKVKIIRQLNPHFFRRVLAAPIAATTSEREAIKLQPRPRFN